MLNVQYRMHPAIGDAISEAFYDGQLTSGPEDRSSPSHHDWLASKQPQWGLFENHPLVWVESAHPTAPRCKDYSELEVRIIRDLVQRALLATRASGAEARPDTFLGIISFYSEQVRQLQEAIATLPAAKGRVEIGTVDSFQGKEYPLTILSCCRHDPTHGEVGFLRLPNRVNVALSRAQCQLIIVGSAATLLHPESSRGSTPLKDFCRAAGANLYRTEPV
jgi:superfamily I DNA and/or RNA helicase